MSPRTYPLRAIVLRGRALGEKDRILVLLSEDRGKVSVVARGARNPKSKLAAASQPFTLARFLVARGRNLDVVSQAEIEIAHTHLVIDLEKSAWATYFCELADVIPEDLPEAELFQLLLIALARLDGCSQRIDFEITGRWFEAQFLRLLGYALTIGSCVSCGTKIAVAPEITDRKILFSPAHGGTMCSACVAKNSGLLALEVQALRALHHLTRAPQPPEAADFELRWHLNSAARRDLQGALQQSVFFHLGVRLKSKAFLDEVLSSSH